MKYMVAIIQPDRIGEVLDRLSEKDIHLVTVSKVLGRGPQGGAAPGYRSHAAEGGLLSLAKLEFAVTDQAADVALEAIEGGAGAGQDGDGKIFVMDLEQAVHIRTGGRGSTVTG